MRVAGEEAGTPVVDSALGKLGEFLRGRRRLLTPEQAGIEPARRRRRTPGLRREEVAARAGISADWYTRLELGSGAVPSTQTLSAVARALQLDDVDTRYLFELAKLPVPHAERVTAPASFAALEHAILNLRDTAAEAFDLYGNPLCWNAAADGLFRWSRYADAFSRNMIVAGLNNPYYRAFFGDDFETVARGVLGLFRRAFTTAAEPPPLAQRVYAFAVQHEYFRKLWDEHTVTEDHTPPGPFVRYVPELGPLKLDFNDLTPLVRRDLVIRIVAPHDEEARAKFPALEALGTPSAFIDPGA